MRKEMENIENGWFKEIDERQMPGQYFAMEINKVLHHEKSKHQDILFLDTTTYGTVLVLDGIIQCTERDEYSYQEMISFLPLCAHKNPENVLIVGGGDGGVAREVTKHPLVKRITQVEIDAKVVEMSKRYLPGMAKGFASPKLNLIIGDGFEYMKNHQNEFDVIITDSGDPIGPAANLFSESYFQLLKQALKPGGVICSQMGCIWLDLALIKRVIGDCRKIYKNVKYANTSVPTYPCGQIGFLIASLDDSCDVALPKINFTSDKLKELDLKYYSTEMHGSAFVLPNFAATELYS